MGYQFQFVTLAGFHSLNLSMFELASGYKQSGMAAYSELQEKEFRSEVQQGYEAVKHQRFVGTGYFDLVQQVISGGLASTVALAESTEAEQFAEKKPVARANHAGDTDYSQVTIALEVGTEEILLPSGD